MPIYEYRCDACGNEHEAIRKFSDAPLTTCPSCGKETLVKKVSAAGFHLKGSGWYQTDFRGGNKPAAADTATPGGDGASPASSADTKSTDTKSTDAAPASKTETSTPKSDAKATPKSDAKAAPSGGTAAAS